MKKLFAAFLLCMAILLVSRTTKAQDFGGLISGPVTHTNAMADTVLLGIVGGRSVVSFKYDITKTSGTVAGTIVLQGRFTTASGEQWATLNSYTLTDATATNLVTYQYNPAVKYRIITTTSGTSVTVHNKYLLYRGLLTVR